MQVNLTNNQQNIQRLAVNVREAQEAARANNVQNNNTETVTNPNTATRQPETDTFNNNQADAAKELTKNLIKGSAMAYLVGFCFGCCPGLFMIAAGAFLFSNQGQSFRDKLATAITENANALQQFQQQQANATQNQQAQPAESAQQTAQTQATTVTNPIQQPQQAEEQRELTPLEKAQQRYAKAQDYQDKAALNLARKEEAQRVAEEKLELAQAKLEKAQMEYDKAKAEVKMQMTERMTRLTQSVATKQANANVAREKTDVARALLEEAGVKLEKAQRAYEDLQAEEIVDV